MIIARDEAMQDLGKKQSLLYSKPSHDAEVDGNQLALIVDEQISGMHVGVKEAVTQCVAQKRLDQRAGKPAQVEALGLQAGAIRKWRRVDPFERQNFLAGAVPIDGR